MGLAEKYFGGLSGTFEGNLPHTECKFTGGEVVTVPVAIISVVAVVFVVALISVVTVVVAAVAVVVFNVATVVVVVFVVVFVVVVVFDVAIVVFVFVVTPNHPPPPLTHSRLGCMTATCHWCTWR